MTDVLDDPDNLRRVMGYYGRDPRVRLTLVEEEVLCEFPEQEWTVHEFVALINEALLKIPEEYRAQALVSLEGDWEERTRLVVSYKRPETNAEMAGRMEEALRYLQRQESYERDAFARLKRKFES